MLLALVTVGQAQPRGPVREIIPLTGDLYRARNGNWYTIFLVTRDGIILGDPINPAFATWLKDELGSRFKVPVRYVVYSHSHFDHAAGGAVFADTARFVAHEHMLRNLDGRYPHMPGDMVDRNRNGAIDPDEIDIPTKAAPGICGMGPGFLARSIATRTAWCRRRSCKLTSILPTSSIRSGCGSCSAGGRST